MARSLQKVKAEAERLDVMDTAAGIMAEHLYTDNLLEEVTQYRSIMLHVSYRGNVTPPTYVLCLFCLLIVGSV